MTKRTTTLQPYVARVAAEWDLDTPGEQWRQIDGSLLFADISGFTNLSERLARKGRIGAEELTAVLNHVFGKMLDAAYARGGSLLKFGGDALLLQFTSEDHAMQAVASAVEMRAALRDAVNRPTSVGRIKLRMSSGVHSGPIDLFLVGDSHRELIVTGPAASITTQMEGSADAGEIVVSRETKTLIPKDFAGSKKGAGWLLRKRTISHPQSGVDLRRQVDDDDRLQFVPTGLRERLGAGIGDPEHRLATIGFVKFKGVDVLLEEAGPEVVAKELHRLVVAIQKGADREGVTFLASDIDADGGKIILSAGVPISQPDDEGRVLRAARTLLDAPCALSVRVGVNRGHVFSGDVGTEHRRTYTVMGDTVNLAARLMATAEPGMLYASPDVLERATTLFRTEALEPFHVKGKDEPVVAYAVREEVGTREPASLHELPFHGREAELEMLVSIVTTCATAGRGGTMTITGDTGTGKSRLIIEVLARCPGLSTLTIQAEPNGKDNPYWAFRDPMRSMLDIQRATNEEMATRLSARIQAIAPDLGWAVPLLGDLMHIAVEDNDVTSVLDPQFRPQRLADAVAELLDTTETGPLAVLAEDGHWMDDASIQLLRRIGTAAETRPWTVIFTARREDTEFEPIGDEVPLRPINDEAVRAIAIEATQAAPLRPHELDLLVDRSGGNPLFLEQLLSLMRETGSAESLPESLSAVVSTEIDTLPPLTRQLLQYSSVLGRSFNRELLDMFLAPDDVELDEATRKEVDRFLDVHGDRVRFRRAIVQDAAYEGLSFRRRRELHRRAAELVEGLAGKNADGAAEFLALHSANAGIHHKAWHFSRIAGDRAKEAYANVEAAVHYGRALEAASKVPDVPALDVASVWSHLGEVQDLAGRYEEARESFSRALRSSEGDPIVSASLFLRRAEAWYGTGNLTQAKRSLTMGKKALAKSSGRESERALARLEAWEASVAAASGDPIIARGAASNAIERATSTHEKEALARAYTALDWANFVMGTGEPRIGERVVEIYDELGMRNRSVAVLNNLGAFSYFEGDWDTTMEWYRAGVEAAEASGNVVEAAHIRTAIAEVLNNQRRFEEAVPLIEEAERVMRSSRAEASLPFVALQRCRALLGLGDIDNGVLELQRLSAAQLEGGETEWTGDTVIALVTALVDTSRPYEATDWLDRLSADSPDSFEWVLAGVLRVRGRVMVEEGHLPEAAELFNQALEAAVEKGDFFEQVLIREAEAELLGRVEDSPDPTVLEELDQLYERLGVTQRLALLAT